MVAENGKVSRMRRSSRFTVDYLVSQDPKDIMFDLTYGDVDYHEWKGTIKQTGNDTALPGPVHAMLNGLKTAGIFVRLRRADHGITMSGIQEFANSVVAPYYAEADQAQAKTYWGAWAEEQLLWKNIAPFVWVNIDSLRQLGQRWTDTTTNAEEINFKIGKRMRFDSLYEATAIINSEGSIANDRAGTWLTGRPVTGTLTGRESGRFLVDTATGMPTFIDEFVLAEGDVEIAGQKGKVKILQLIKMNGGRLK
jgi:hypothetical protein